jgi:O-acetyl-ADP-ribose deacetylase (regulator of RNase III)/NAD-dependent SIR2 family protein deacetylase
MIPSITLQKVLTDLIEEAESYESFHDSHRCHSHSHQPSHEATSQMNSRAQLHLLKELLCTRSPSDPLTPQTVSMIDTVLSHDLSHKSTTDASLLLPSAKVPRPGSTATPPVNITLWRGDITSLAGVTAIVNAANAQMLGCFQPRHRCIDNIIHGAAGPRLRHECSEIMDRRAYKDYDVGEVMTTKAYNLRAEHVLHVAGPQIKKGHSPTERQRDELRRCYTGVMSAAEKINPSKNGKKIVAICCISTGIYSFPNSLAATIATETINQYISCHPETTITDIIFNVFTSTDYEAYTDLLTQPEFAVQTSELIATSQPPSKMIQTAAQWLLEADKILITAGAGLSAATGLDYESTSLFETHFPAFLTHGIRCLYDVFGIRTWPSQAMKWGYYVTHLNMVWSWPSPLYNSLLTLANEFGPGGAFVRTSNADGFFVKNGFDRDVVATPQGAYEVLQCMANCRPDATFAAAPFVEAATPHIDPTTQFLTDESKIPWCKYCGGEMMICVRAANWFNERPFVQGERKWREFRKGMLNAGTGKTVILELGVGLSTPGVLSLPNENLVMRGDGNIRLIKAGLGPAGSVDWELEDEGLAVGIDGDLAITLSQLLRLRNGERE